MTPTECLRPRFSAEWLPLRFDTAIIKALHSLTDPQLTNTACSAVHLSAAVEEQCNTVASY